MTILKITAAMLVLFVSLPIWFFLLYQILVAVNASQAMWAAYFVYVPVSIIVSAISQAISNAK